MVKYQVGSKVKFLNESLEGTITSVLSDTELLVLCSDSFERKAYTSEILVIVGEDDVFYSTDNEQSILMTFEEQGSKGAGILSKYLKKNKQGSNIEVEIDLHLEKLVEFPEGLDDRQKLLTQINHAKDCIISARDLGLKRLVFIHGVGTGVLKTELLNFISTMEDLKTKDADFRKYGMGATEVILCS